MDTKNLSCPVETPEVFGEYANAFRIMPAGGEDLFLDFCIYSEQSNRAKVVSRVRVRPEFLSVMLNRINSDIIISSDTPANRLFFVLPGTLDEN
jgi:hypothetical protein